MQSKSKDIIFDFTCYFSGNCVFLLKCDILLQMFSILSFRNFVNCVILCMLEFWISGEMGQHAHHIQNCTARVSQVFHSVLAFWPFFVAISLEKSRVQKTPLSGQFWIHDFCCVGQFGSIGKSTILVCKLAKSKKSALCWSGDHHMAKMAS